MPGLLFVTFIYFSLTHNWHMALWMTLSDKSYTIWPNSKIPVKFFFQNSPLICLILNETHSNNKHFSDTFHTFQILSTRFTYFPHVSHTFHTFHILPHVSHTFYMFHILSTCFTYFLHVSHTFYTFHILSTRFTYFLHVSHTFYTFHIFSTRLAFSRSRQAENVDIYFRFWPENADLIKSIFQRHF